MVLTLNFALVGYIKVYFMCSSYTLLLQVQLLHTSQVGPQCAAYSRGAGSHLHPCDRVDREKAPVWVPGQSVCHCISRKPLRSKAPWYQLSSGFPFPSHQKVFVMPNMDDLYLPLMTSALENPAAPQQSSDHIPSKQSSVDSQDYLSE